MTDNTLNDSLDNLFTGDTGPVRTTAQVERPAAREHIEAREAAGYVQICGRCRGTGQTPWGICFKCKGAKQKTFKTSPEARAAAAVARADRKAARETQAVEAWQAENPAAYEWLVATAPRWDLAQKFLNALRQYGDLTPGQLAVVTKGIARDAERAAQRTQQAAAAPVVAAEGIDGLKAAFDKAVAYTAAKGLKLSPRITVGGITISPAKADGKNPGALYVKAGQTYLGKVAQGRFFAARECTAEDQAKVVEFIANPAEAAKVYGQTTGTCCICNATLRSEWKNRGIGPICAEKFGW